jgi:ribosomal protein S18 acetylase RimI-like enzyme
MAYVLIRVARIEDAPFVVDMIRSAADEGVFHSITLTVGEHIREFRNFAFENPPEGYLLLICQIGDEIVGYIDSRVRRGVGCILGIYVKPCYRKRSIGKKLVDKTLHSFKKRGCHKARLEVFADNKEAIGFYTRLNFIQEGFLHHDEGKKDIIIMSKFLNRKTLSTMRKEEACETHPIAMLKPKRYGLSVAVNEIWC